MLDLDPDMRLFISCIPEVIKFVVWVFCPKCLSKEDVQTYRAAKHVLARPKKTETILNNFIPLDLTVTQSFPPDTEAVNIQLEPPDKKSHFTFQNIGVAGCILLLQSCTLFVLFRAFFERPSPGCTVLYHC